MKIDEDILRIARLLLDEPTDKKGVGRATIYSNKDKSRHPHCPAYQHPSTVPKMAEMGLVKILETKEHGKPVGMKIQIFPYYEIQFSLEKMKKYLRGEPKRPSIEEITGSMKIFECGELKINLSEATMQYRNKPPTDISPDNDEIKFLVFLLKRKGILVEYVDIAKGLNLSCYHENVNNKDMSRPVQLLKKSTKKALFKAGLTHKEFKELIIPKKNIGYILSCK